MTFSKKLKRTLKKTDLFSQDISFQDPRGESFSSTFGACLSIMILIIIFLYASKKAIILKQRDETLITEYIESDLLDEGSFGYEETGFYLSLQIKMRERGGIGNMDMQNFEEYFSIRGISRLAN